MTSSARHALALVAFALGTLPAHGRADEVGAALDRGVDFPVPQEELCERCRALFATLDLGRDTCRRLGQGELPAALRRELLTVFGQDN